MSEPVWCRSEAIADDMSGRAIFVAVKELTVFDVRIYGFHMNPALKWTGDILFIKQLAIYEHVCLFNVFSTVSVIKLRGAINITKKALLSDEGDDRIQVLVTRRESHEGFLILYVGVTVLKILYMKLHAVAVKPRRDGWRSDHAVQ